MILHEKLKFAGSLKDSITLKTVSLVRFTPYLWFQASNTCLKQKTKAVTRQERVTHIQVTVELPF